MQGMNAAEYDRGWETEWSDMKQYGPFSRHLRRLIFDLIRPLEFESVLDVGCGQGSFLEGLRFKFPQVKLHGTEISHQAIAMARSRVPEGRFEFLDLAQGHLNETFDLIVCSEVLEHIQDDTSAIRHLRAMTNKYLIVSSPQGRMRSLEPAAYGHVRNYARGELVAKLKQAGLYVLKVIEWGFPLYSPLYRDLMNLIGGRGTTGQYGAGQKLAAQILYLLFKLNSSKRGDELVVLAEPATQLQAEGE
jgi:SAM-dependent methyltransferase